MRNYQILHNKSGVRDGLTPLRSLPQTTTYLHQICAQRNYLALTCRVGQGRNRVALSSNLAVSCPFPTYLRSGAWAVIPVEYIKCTPIVAYRQSSLLPDGDLDVGSCLSRATVTIIVIDHGQAHGPREQADTTSNCKTATLGYEWLRGGDK